MTSPERLTTVIAPALEGLGLDLVDVAVTPAGKRRVVRVLVATAVTALPDDETTPVAPITLDEVADATRAISDRLDESDVLGQAPYVLEVSSPGVDRPLTDRAGLRRNVGRLVVAHLADGTTRTGRIVAVGDDRARLQGETGTHDLPLDSFSSADIQVEFTPAGAPTTKEHPDGH